MSNTILFVDDDEALLQAMRRTLREYDIEIESDPRRGMEKAGRKNAYAVIVADMLMPGVDGISILAASARRSPATARIMLTGHPDVSTAIEAVNKGQVFRFLTKPCSPATLKETLDAALIHNRMRTGRLGAAAGSEAGDREADAGLPGMAGMSPRMRSIFGMVRQLAAVDTTVLVTGESGTGKELIVEALHGLGPRAKGPLVKVNCSALSAGLMESELFGHVRGAFTGAVRDKVGRFDAAKGGTIFLDEIGDISPDIQLKLLRVLEQKEFERVGESVLRKADARVVTATNVNLWQKVKEGAFREDLYYRLRVMEVNLPPLRERTEDIPLLIEHFVRHFAQQLKRDVTGISSDLLSLFLRYPWPGNVRELKHAIEHAVVLCQSGNIGLAHLPAELAAFGGPGRGPGADMDVPLGRGEILAALSRTDWNKAKTARLLNISRSTLYRKMLELGVSRLED